MLILRFETDDRIGMYRSSATVRDKCSNNQECYRETGRHPSPFVDSALRWEKILPKDRADYVFGFADVKQARRWLYEDAWLFSMDIEGIFACWYDTDAETTHVGHTQACFVAHTATLVRRVRPTDLIGWEDTPS